MAARVAGGLDNGGQAVFGNAQECMWVGCGVHRVHGDLDRALSAVLEAWLWNGVFKTIQDVVPYPRAGQPGMIDSPIGKDDPDASSRCN